MIGPLAKNLPEPVNKALETLKRDGDWALLGEWFLIRLPLDGSDKIVVAKIVLEEEILPR